MHAKISKFKIGGAAALLVAVAVLSPGQASAATETFSPGRADPGVVTANDAQQVPSNIVDPGDQAAVLAKLRSLVGKQTPEELEAIESSGRPAQLLADSNGKTIAGYIEWNIDNSLLMSLAST